MSCYFSLHVMCGLELSWTFNNTKQYIAFHTDIIVCIYRSVWVWWGCCIIWPIPRLGPSPCWTSGHDSSFLLGECWKWPTWTTPVLRRRLAPRLLLQTVSWSSLPVTSLSPATRAAARASMKKETSTMPTGTRLWSQISALGFICVFCVADIYFFQIFQIFLHLLVTSQRPLSTETPPRQNRQLYRWVWFHYLRSLMEKVGHISLSWI